MVSSTDIPMDAETMTIGELAERTGLAPSTIRFYQRRGLLPARAAGSGWQRFGPDTLARLAMIELAKRTGFSLDEITELLAALDTEVSPVSAWKDLARAKLDDIDAQTARLQQMRELLAEALECSCLTLARAQLVPVALGWATAQATVREDSSRAADARRRH